ncbi:MAG: Hsp70 family protein, partial [Bradymonadaceae bacterium]
AGDTFLGGEDFDARIIEHLSYEFAREHEVDLRQDDMALQRLRDAAEEAKIELSSVRETELSLPFLYTRDDGEALHLQTTLTREKLEDLVEDLIHRTTKICRATLEEAGLETADVDDVILVGGMTRMPRIQQEVEEFFGQAPSKKVHPDEVVGVGAAIQGETLMDEDEDVLLLDVTPHSLGIMVHGGGYERLIEANSTIPTSESRIFTTVRDEQTSVKIVVLQGESDDAEENELLGEFVLSGLREAPAGEVEIEVEFSISADGIVSVSATDLETGKEQSITVTASSDLTEEEIDRMVERNEDYLMEVKRGEDLEQERTALQKTIREIDDLVSQVDEEEASDLLVQAKERAVEAVERARDSIDSEDIEELEELNEKLDRALEAFRGVFQRT